MKIPYGMSDFGQLRSEGYFYADKTPFLPILEGAEAGYRNLLFLRPRRFGKSTLVSMLAYYYDIDRQDRFDALFQGLWIHEHPTPERNRYLVMHLDFSKLTTGGSGDALREGFCEAVKSSLRTFLLRYSARIPQLAVLYDRLDGYHDATALISNVLGILASTEYKLYVLIDEYDNFANQLLSDGAESLYEDTISNRSGFVRGFFAALKAGTGTGLIARMFITGVTPLMLGDMSSGFNIATNVSQAVDLNTLAGFTRADVERAVEEFLAARPALAKLPGISSRTELFDVLVQYYNGYRFTPQATERVFNSDMVLYFLAQVHTGRQYPRDMLDMNVRTDYRHLRRIGKLGGTGASARRDLFETILTEGHIESDLVPQFGVKNLPSRGPFLSLVYYLGMLTLSDAPPAAEGYDLEIPNRVIRELQWEHLAQMLEDQGEVAIQIDELRAAVGAMAVQGDIQPFLSVFHTQVIQAFGLKDLRGLDEKTIKLLFMMYVSLGRVFHPLSEKEFAQGYCDLFLGPSASAPYARFSWLLEFKYLPTGAKTTHIDAAFAQAQAQVERYASDTALLPLVKGDRELKAGMLVFLGAKKILFRPWPPEPGPALRTGKERSKPSAKPEAAKKPAARRKPAARKPAARKPAARKPTIRKAPARRTGR